MQRKSTGRVGATSQQQRQQPWKVGKVSRNQDVSSLAREPIAHSERRIVWLQICGRREFGQRVTGSPERLRGLAGAQLAAMPYDGGARASSRCFAGEACGVHFAALGKRPTRVDLGPDRFGMVNEEESQGRALGQSLLSLYDFACG